MVHVFYFLSKILIFICNPSTVKPRTFWTISLTARSLPASCPTNNSSCSTVCVAVFLIKTKLSFSDNRNRVENCVAHIFQGSLIPDTTRYMYYIWYLLGSAVAQQFAPQVLDLAVQVWALPRVIVVWLLSSSAWYFTLRVPLFAFFILTQLFWWETDIPTPSKAWSTKKEVLYLSYMDIAGKLI